MDINQPSFSRSKPGKPGIARSISENKAASEIYKGKDSHSPQQVSDTRLQELKEGQVVKGQIIDHRYNEIKIQLEPSKQIVSAKLSGDVPLAIGQEAQFLVTEEGSDRLVLKYIPESTSPSEATIQKALIASGLPMNDRNRAIVEELLKHTMPVDKQTLQTLIRLSHTNRDASPLTLVLMYKNNFPMTPANIRQFEAYQNGSSRLLNDIHRITTRISELLQVDTLPISQASPEHKDLLSEEVGQISPQNTKPHIGPDATVKIQEATTKSLTQVLQTNNELLDILLGNPKLPSDAADHTSSDLTSLLTQLKQGAISREAFISHIKELYPDIEHVLTADPNQVVPTPNNEAQAPPIPDTLSSLIKQIAQANDDRMPLSGLLNPREQASFADLLRSDPSLSQIADKVMEGTITTRELLTTLKNTLPVMEGTLAERLLASPEYRTLLENAFHDKWTITPEKLSDKAALQELYENLREDMELLSNLTKLELPIKEEAKLQEPIKNLQENLRFMQDLNELYTYLQLPVQLKNQDIHSDLYVFTRKKSLQNKEDLSVLLHLDMTNLGSMNIHIRMNHNIVQAKFYIEDRDAQRLITEYMPSLTDALTKKGYNLHSEVSQSYEKIDFSKDFIEDRVSESDVRRYSFDIRT
ncbi:MAG: hypothetical protein K0R34_4118 [Herbinix sp.]|jgi:hypothetical protein|nr:hypothetical protein [Herbinix sp.]